MMEESRRLQKHGLVGGPNVRAINVAISTLPSCCPEHGGQCPQQGELRALVRIAVGDTEGAYTDYTTIIDNASHPKDRCDAYYNRAFCKGDVDMCDITKAHDIYPEDDQPVRVIISKLLNVAT